MIQPGFVDDLKAPFPYFGGKSAVAGIVWEQLGDVRHYIEPFFGSGAVLLSRPNYVPTRDTETVNDKDGHIANVWRSLQADPDEVARWCDWPVNHADLSARKGELLRQGDGLLARLVESPDYYDAKLAGYWIWAASCWIGSGLTSIGQIPHLSGTGHGVHRTGQIPHLSGTGVGVQKPYKISLYDWFRKLSERLRYVRVVCGDWSRVCGGHWQNKFGTVGIFMDPPYSHDCGRDNALYSVDENISAEVGRWCLERGKLADYRIVLAGYDGEHDYLEEHGWSVYRWSSGGGYGNTSGDKDSRGKENRHRERLWFSPHCCGGRQTRLF
jgi:DNA adenine methylase